MEPDAKCHHGGLCSGRSINDALKAAMVASANESVTLYAVWKDKTTHTVTFNAGTNGSFANTSDPLINQTVIKGLSVTGVPAVTASGRYRFDGWKLDGDSSGKVYTNDEVKAMVINGNMTFTASYTYVGGSSGGGGSVSSYIIKATAGANGSISPNGTISVSRGADKTFSIKANAGYEIVDVRVDGTSVGAVRTYEFKNVTKAHEIYATFKKTESEPEQEVADPEKTGVARLLETVKHNAYLHGYGNGGFGPNNNMTRAEAAQMFYNLLRQKNVTVTVQFSDVSDDAWYATAVNTLASLGILKGVGEDKYDPTRAISRAEFAAIATRFAKVNLEGSTPFDDVSDADWYYNAVLTAVNYGWINGYGDNTFRPYNTVTRAEVTTIVNRMLARRADKDFVADHIHNMRTFNDVDSSFWAYHYIMEATNGHDYDKDEHTEIWKSYTAQ
nr:S-layer homology domain-containing protein [Butyricicoccus sp. OM06-6AC]